MLHCIVLKLRTGIIFKLEKLPPGSARHTEWTVRAQWLIEMKGLGGVIGRNLICVKGLGTCFLVRANDVYRVKWLYKINTSKQGLAETEY